MKKIDRNTRFYIDLDLKNNKIISWNYGQKQKIDQVLLDPDHKRIFITKGQFNKLDKVQI